MSSVTNRRRSTKNLTTTRPFPAFETDPRAWHKAARDTLADLLAAAEDAVRPLGKRELGRVEHIHLIAESGSALYDLLDRIPGRDG